MTKTATLLNGTDIADFGGGLRFKSNQPASSDYLITIEPLDADKQLSIQERKVIFMWCSEWSEQTGLTQMACYSEFKVRFLFRQMKMTKKLEATRTLITDLWANITPEFRYLAIGEHIRSDWASHDEFHEALTQFKLWAETDAGLTLTPPDKYRQARELAISSGSTTKVK